MSTLFLNFSPFYQDKSLPMEINAQLHCFHWFPWQQLHHKLSSNTDFFLLKEPCAFYGRKLSIVTF